MPCERRTLRGSDRCQLIAEVVQRLRRGELCVLPTETVYGLAVLPSHEAAVARARALKARDRAQQFTWHIARRQDLERLVPTVPLGVRRLVQRFWPGPLTVILPARDGGTAGVRLPGHDFTREVITACGEPLWLTSVNLSGQPPMLDAAAIAERFASELQLVVDDGPPPLGIASTIVRKIGPRLEVLREGLLTADDVQRSAADLVLFVCTGNTCRSPLAEVLARELTSRKLGVPQSEVIAYGVAFASAGTGAEDGWPASDGSIEAAAEIQLDLSSHSSRVVDPELIERATRIYCAGQNHRRAILAEVPEATDKIAMLRPDGLDIADPFGGTTKDYRRARDEIRAAVAARLPEWLPAG
jgi:protein-tyrosine phosphatase